MHETYDFEDENISLYEKESFSNILDLLKIISNGYALLTVMKLGEEYKKMSPSLNDLYPEISQKSLSFFGKSTSKRNYINILNKMKKFGIISQTGKRKNFKFSLTETVGYNIYLLLVSLIKKIAPKEPPGILFHDALEISYATKKIPNIERLTFKKLKKVETIPTKIVCTFPFDIQYSFYFMKSLENQLTIERFKKYIRIHLLIKSVSNNSEDPEEIFMKKGEREELVHIFQTIAKLILLDLVDAFNKNNIPGKNYIIEKLEELTIDHIENNCRITGVE